MKHIAAVLLASLAAIQTLSALCQESEASRVAVHDWPTPPGVDGAPMADAPAQPLPQGAILRLGSETFRHPRASAVAYSPDGAVVITAGYDIRLWDTKTLRLLRTIPLNRGEFGLTWRVQVSTDGKTLFAMGYKSLLLAFDMASGRQQARLPLPSHMVAVSPDGQTLAVDNAKKGSNISELTLWSVATKKALWTLPGHQRTIPTPPEYKDYLVVDSAIFSPDGKWLASMSSGQDDTVRVYEVATGKEKFALRRHRYLHFPLAFSPEGYLVVDSAREPPLNQKATLSFWDLNTGQLHSEIEDPPGRFSLTFSPDGKWLAGGVGSNHQIAVWNRATGKVRFTTPINNPAHSMAFSKDGDTLISCNAWAPLEMWDLKNGRSLLAHEGHTNVIRSLSLSRDGNTAATSGWDHVARLWDTRTGKILRRLELGRAGATSVAVSPDGRIVAVANTDATLFDVATGAGLRRFAVGDRFWGCHLDFSPDGKTLAIADSMLQYRFVDPATGQVKRTFSWGPFSAIGKQLWHVPMRFSPNGKHFAGMHWQGNFAVALWDLGQPEPKIVSKRTDNLADIAFSPDGEYLAWSDADGVHLWDVRESKVKESLAGIAPCRLAFTPDGRFLVAGKKLHPLLPDLVPGVLPVQPGLLAFSQAGGILVAVPDEGCTALVFDGKKLAGPGKR